MAELNLSNFIEEAREVAQALNEFADNLEQIEKKYAESNCEDCDYTDIADWEQDKTTGKAKPVYWCERYREMCSSISECQYKEREEEYGYTDR